MSLQFSCIRGVSDTTVRSEPYYFFFFFFFFFFLFREQACHVGPGVPNV